MASVSFRINSAGARELLSSEAAARLVGDLADRCASACNAEASEDGMLNDPFSSHVETRRGRARAAVVTSSPHGVRHNAKHDTIIRNLG